MGALKATAARTDDRQYRDLLQATGAALWELDFEGVEILVDELVRSGTTDLAAYLAADAAFARRLLGAVTILDFNERAVDVFGLVRKDEVTASLARFWPDESLHVFSAGVVAVLEGRSHFSAETRLRAIDGRTIEASFTVVSSGRLKGASRLLVAIADLTSTVAARAELALSEQRYRNLFQNMPVSVWQIDTRGLNALFADLRAQGVKELSTYIDRYPGFLREAMEASIAVDINEMTLRLFGAETHAQLLGPVTRFWPTDRHNAFRLSIEAGYRGDAGCQCEARIVRLDGREIDVLFTSAAPANLRAKGTVIVGILDIGDRVRAQDLLHRTQAEFAHAARVSMLGELTASIAHEVSQPLMAVMTNCGAALRWIDRPEPDVAEVRDLTMRSLSESRRAADIIGRVRSMATQTAVEHAPTLLNDLIEEAIVFLRPELRRNGVTASLDLAGDLPTIIADRVQLQQVIVNLTMNAIQAMAHAASPIRDVSLRTWWNPDGWIVVEVSDTGPGINPLLHSRLFESFFTTKPTGMGIGLPICRSIIEAHGGRIDASNRSHCPGARFKIDLPAARLDRPTTASAD